MGSLWLSSAEFLPPTKLVKTWVVNEGTREPSSRIECSSSSTSSSIVAPGRTFGATTAIVSSHTRQARSMTSSSAGDFVRRSSFTSAEPVTMRSGDNASVRWSSVSAQIRSPTASFRVSPMPTAAVSNNAAPVVALGDDHDLARQLSGEVEQGHHPRQDEDGIAIGRGRTRLPPSRARTAIGRRSGWPAPRR